MVFVGRDAADDWRSVRDHMDALDEELEDARRSATPAPGGRVRRSGPERSPYSHDALILGLLGSRAGTWVSYDEIEDQTGLHREQIQKAVSRLEGRISPGHLARRTVGGRRQVRLGRLPSV